MGKGWPRPSRQQYLQGSFWKEFFPLHAEAVATNALEGTAYFQDTQNVDDYLDEFRNLISELGYTSPKTIVVKLRRGLDPKISDAVATMAANRPDDLDPEAWFEAAIRIDQAHAANAAFQASIHPVLAVPEIVPTEVPPPFQEIVEEPSAGQTGRKKITGRRHQHQPMDWQLDQHILA